LFDHVQFFLIRLNVRYLNNFKKSEQLFFSKFESFFPLIYSLKNPVPSQGNPNEVSLCISPHQRVFLRTTNRKNFKQYPVEAQHAGMHVYMGISC